MSEKYTDLNTFDGNIIMSRIRLARNIKGLPFRIKDQVVAREVVKRVNRALVRSDTFNLYFVSNLSDIKLEAMKERHLISENLIENADFGAALINQDESMSVMVNEEDHIREQCFMKGFKLDEVYKRLNKIDDEIEKNLDIAYDDNLGYLQAIPRAPSRATILQSYSRWWSYHHFLLRQSQ